MHKHFALVVSTFVLIAGSAAAQRVEPAFVRDAVGLRAAAAAPHIADRAEIEPVLALGAAAEEVPEEVDAVREWNAQGRFPAKNGFTRAIGEAVRVRLTSAETAAQIAGGGIVTDSGHGTKVWSGSVRVAGAYRMRLHLRNVAVPQGTTFWVYGRDGEAVAFGTELVDASGELYTPSIGGDVAYLEMEVPSGSAGAAFDIADVLELVGGFGGPKPEDVPSCLVDATCISSSTLDVIDLYRRAIADLFYVKAGSGFVCTGGLLNDSDSSTSIPYLLTANHCFSTQTVATTLEAFWDYRTSSCNGSFPNMNASERSNGSTLLATGTTSDFTFVRLSSIPAGRAFLGWDANTSVITAGATLYRVSHPFPDSFSNPAPQRFSTTNVTLTSPTCSGRPRGPYTYSTQGTGGVYGGSSGSPVILAGGYVVGQLFGSCGPNDPSAGCDASNFTLDGAFATTFPSISSFLTAAPTGGCTPNSTTACMLNNRFRVTVRYRAGFDNAAADSNAFVKSVTGFANPSFETAFFYFNSESNIEMLIKILDQGNTNSQGQPTIAVLFGSATPLRVELTILDTLKGTTKTYSSAFGQMQGTTDFTAFVK
jgi:trypsin-like peptidase